MNMNGESKMKRKIIVLLLCILLTGIQVISVTGFMLDNKTMNDFSNYCIDLKKNNIGGSLNLENWIEQDKLLHPGTTGDNFGRSVSIYGKYAVVGVYSENNNRGSAYIFKRNDTSWDEEQKLTASDGEADDCFGYSVSIGSNFVIIGAYGDDNCTGAVYVYNFTDAGWTEQFKLIAPDGKAGDCFGNSISIDDNFVIIGAYGDDNYAGSAYVLEMCCYWKWREKVNSTSGLPLFGFSVSIYGDYAIVGSPGELSDSTGSAYIYKRDGNGWDEDVYWIGDSGEHLGVSVSIDGNYAIAGAYGYDNSAGAVYTFYREDNVSWSKGQKLTASDGDNFDYFGVSVSIDGNYSIVGAYGDKNEKGSAYIFTRNGTIWSEDQKLIALDGEEGDCFGYSVSINGGYAIIGAYGDDNSKGSAYIFMKEGVPNLSFEITARFGVDVVITNIGDNDTQDISVFIHVNGGFLGMINKSVSEIMDISAGESETVSTGLFFGLGKFNIIVIVNDKEKTDIGLQIIFMTFL
jgi:hypothetical protein